jgi:hypothetical protein
MKPLSEIIDLFLEKLIAKHHGVAFAKIFCNWHKIVDSNLAKICTPRAIYKFDKILAVDIYDKNQARYLYFNQQNIIDRINILLTNHNIRQKILKIQIFRGISDS